ncbi:hypothetical protein P8C59_004910 [Phyllachora maydis]|uniref:Uncharacterized protein n=1 Tax=Phyllachora maydis TaxID=1825666 RepID=A0AAD9I4F7_9PEZI|nr:hypothetical protein P8C59_004910 [Phyllachora maydis]
MRVPGLALGLIGALVGTPLALADLLPKHVPETQAGPIPGNYSGPLRPQVHFSPPQGFMNDPNGLFWDGITSTWHLYYQYNPDGIVAGNQHWGHATSRDLFSWTNQKIALYPPEEHLYVFSGSIVVDVNNTSGLFPKGQNNGVVAIMTLARYYDDGSPGPQQQAVAYSIDSGYTFSWYKDNPVIPSQSTQFRDPKVVWFDNDKEQGGGHWVMVLAYAQEFAVGFFTSPDLLHWTAASNVSHAGLLGAQYECPNLVRMPVRDGVGGPVVGSRWVLAVSVQPGAPLGGSATQYFPGDFDGYTFKPVDGAARLAEFAKDNYASQYFYGTPAGDDAINIGWASNWQYAQKVPSGESEHWRSAMTLPRRHYLTQAPRIGWTLVNTPVDPAPVQDMLLRHVQKAVPATGSLAVIVDYASVASNAVYVDVNVTGLEASALTSYSTLNVTFGTPDLHEALRAGFFFGGDNPFFLDRGNISGAFRENPFATDKMSVADVWNATAGSWRLQAVVDRSVMEVFVDGGIHTGTAVFYPEGERLSLLRLAVEDLPKGSELSVKVWGLKSTWAAMVDKSGLVRGNDTTNHN